jgi:hypothetical protein
MVTSAGLLCSAFQLGDGIENQLNGLEGTALITKFILITRRLNNMITLYEIFKIIPFNYEEVLYELSKSGYYIEFKKEEIINRYLFDLELSYKEACITKYFISCFDDGNHFMAHCIISLVLTFKLLKRNQGQELSFIYRVLNKIGWPCEKIRVSHLKRISLPPFPIKDVTNNYAREILQKHVWFNRS